MMKTPVLVFEPKGEIFQAAVFADTHGNSDYMTNVVQDHGPFDLIVHLGDGVYEGGKVAQAFGIPCCCVYGNEDFGSQVPERQIFRVNHVNVFAMHGHQLDINPYQTEDVWDQHFIDLAGIATRVGAKVIFFGHSHRPVLTSRDGILICNPGNHYRGSNHPAGYARLTVRPEEFRIALYKRVAENQWEEAQQITQFIQT